jgi:methylglutaconyl-CoA hydratase
MADPACIEVRREGDVEHLLLNRPEVRNAFNETLIAQVTAWAGRAAADPRLRAVVIAGAGPSFCAGADLAWMTKMAASSREDNLRDARAAARMFEAIDTLPVPVIARVHGAALGGGAGLAAVADIAVADEGATFGFTEVKLGLIPSIIAPYVLAKIGNSAARELFVTARRFNADRARDIGLVHAVVAAADLDRHVRLYLDDVLANGRDAMAAAKALLRRIANRSIEDATPLTTEAIAERRVSPEAQERMKAFLKR